MTHQEKIQWMQDYCARNNLTLQLEGECGFGRECVGVLSGKGDKTCYPDYIWFDEDYERLDKNGEVWIPEDAYHKHPCVAVLGRGEGAEAQLFEWLVWFDKNGFRAEVTRSSKNLDPIEVLMGRQWNHRMVKS